MKPVIKVTNKPISIDRTLKMVAGPHAGGTVLFMGTVRDRSDGKAVSKMHIEAAKDLARADLARIANIAAEKYEVSGLSVVHRTGQLKVGEVIVAIAVSAPHRKEAFSACRFVIDELKKTTPIWKKELGRDAERWVAGRR